MAEEIEGANTEAREWKDVFEAEFEEEKVASEGEIAKESVV